MRDGFAHRAGYLDRAAQVELVSAVRQVIAAAPLYVPTMPRTGKPLSVRMTNCGRLGWLTDAAGGYRYEAEHPVTGLAWPAMPARLLAIWRDVVPGAAEPEACLVNWYGPEAKLGLHRDQDEADLTTPVVSISLGCDAWFRLGGLTRREPTQRMLLRSGDLVVLGGAARLAFHGIDRILAGSSDLIGEPGRINLTLRRVTVAGA